MHGQRHIYCLTWGNQTLHQQNQLPADCNGFLENTDERLKKICRAGTRDYAEEISAPLARKLQCLLLAHHSGAAWTLQLGQPLEGQPTLATPSRNLESFRALHVLQP